MYHYALPCYLKETPYTCVEEINAYTCVRFLYVWDLACLVARNREERKGGARKCTEIFTHAVWHARNTKEVL